MASTSALHVLDRRDVQRICSGQSVVDLATAVKELVENALDAGATQIEVKLKEFGRDAFEVSDNGAGVAPENYASLARKHYTSKISSFEDIETVASFGFRGEALSSICELAASFTVCTRTQNDAVGTLLMYDASGALVKETKKARPTGTTVAVEELFKPLAVRYKDFKRNIKKHYAKLLKVLQAYAVSCANVKICVFNITGKNSSRHVVLATQAHQTMGENIANVFGTKFFRTLIRSSTTETEDNLSGQERKVEGYVSKVGAGVGRSDNDRQFFFINGRPFDLPKMAKTLNEVWRQYEMKQKPACILNFLLPLGDYDVNVTPDKRETFVKHEAEIIDAFKTGINKLYEPSRGTFTVQPLLTAFAQRFPAQKPKPVIVEILQPRNQRGAASAPSSPEQILLDLRKSAKRQKLYSPLPSQAILSTPEEHAWSFDEMIKQRQQYFEEEVEYERKRKTNRLKVPKTCSTSVDDNALETDNEVAAAALQRVLKKEDFKRMQVLGQFNLGFIIGKLGNDLFIIDQHASDEKFNYETLQQTTVMHQQPLVRPLRLELTAGEEMVILDHLGVFTKNGFTFLVDKDAPATKKLKLLSLPFTKHTQFGTEDIRELASLLMDAPMNTSTIRLPKVMAMFASRACRSSIMIGTALHKEEMQKIVRNLSGLDQPWNCPHGRPTLRHLVDLMHLEDSNDSN
ncbi:mismatch repair endonuclease pms1, putative [Phytophthora infestans T30-4]|uniref:Mismatch repair endonuclease pms1, putative n=1 Tax=Phytophthora infestans (strain T30-4) TaxID=403677 RepID=D0N669_PHYIT|nr:mismatch repair endonuclease pms1, putative [Phytophthora infestans T30-4]EEY70560.1 mismatch repair endonuclease pms1, putative [Phytophthora infestans T30-4]|eukprot:XP_002998214.1 mismatch repair endonuclease pms1, putative [Phytophthora infestans T30-4]